MSWARFDDNYSLNPKILTAGYLAELLDMRAIIWCARYETDGFVSSDALSIVGRSIPGVKAKIGKLIEVGRWTEGVDGWWVTHYLNYNPTHEECERRRKEGKERAARSRERKANERRTSEGGSGDPRGGDGLSLPSLNSFAIFECDLCDHNGFVINERNEAEQCSHGQEQSNVAHLRSSSVAETG